MTASPDFKFDRAMAESEDLLARMAEARKSANPIQALTTALWRHRNNVAFMTTVVEAVEEAKAPIAQRADDQLSPPPSHED